jgi:hypothetical protein
MTQKIRIATMYPGAVRNHIHAIDGKNHAAAKRNPGKNDLSRRLTASEPYIAIPTKARGHQPQGGIDAATSKPERIGTKERRIMSVTLRAQRSETLFSLLDDKKIK